MVDLVVSLAVSSAGDGGTQVVRRSRGHLGGRQLCHHQSHQLPGGDGGRAGLSPFRHPAGHHLKSGIFLVVADLASPLSRLSLMYLSHPSQSFPGSPVLFFSDWLNREDSESLTQNVSSFLMTYSTGGSDTVRT